MSALVPLSVEELGRLIGQANQVLAAPDLVALGMTRGQALWLINAGLTELRRHNPNALVEAVERLT